MLSRRQEGPTRWPVLVLCLLALTACRSQEAPPPAEIVVATVNGEKIGLQEYEKALGQEAAFVKGEPLKAEQASSLREEVLNRLIDEKIMLQRARELSITISDAELEARIADIKKDYSNDSFNALFNRDGNRYSVWKQDLRSRMLLEKVIAADVNAKIVVNDSEAEAYFNANRKTYRAERRVHALQIVVRDREVAEEILKRLKAGEDFGKVAREMSIGPEAARGGDLGFFEKGVMPEAIDEVVFSLPIGRVSRVIQSPYGFHIFMVLGREQGGGRRFSEARDRVIADLRKLKEAEAYEQWIEKLKEKAVVQINRPLPEATVPAGAGTGRGVVPAGEAIH